MTRDGGTYVQIAVRCIARLASATVLTSTPFLGAYGALQRSRAANRPRVPYSTMFVSPDGFDFAHPLGTSSFPEIARALTVREL